MVVSSETSVAEAKETEVRTEEPSQEINDEADEKIELSSTDDNVLNETSTPLSYKIKGFLRSSDVFSSHFTGFCLYDIEDDELIVNYNGDKFFTPASNVKILTLYAVLKSFERRIPGMLYRNESDTLFLRPVGDPTLLHPDFPYQSVLTSIQTSNKAIAIEWPEEELDHFGIGWMWDDYNSAYMPEVSWMPVHGNVVSFTYTRPKVTSSPPLFEDLVDIKRVYDGRTNKITRSPKYNFFTAEIRYPNWSFDKNVPFKYDRSLAVKILSERIKKDVSTVSARNLSMDTIYSQPTDTVLARMMQDSDNFLSEQMLLMSALKNGFTNTEDFREYMSEEWFPEIEPVWVDGSGLSRYNLIRPIDQIQLLKRIHSEYSWSRIKNILAQGGVSGTIQNWYPNRPEVPGGPVGPYIFAKTGTLANNHCLSGYLKTQSGKLLIFSLMNNNYVRPTNEVKKEMQKLLEAIRDQY